MPLPDQSFDAATVAFGIRNVVDAEQACREFHRVLRPGGRLLIQVPAYDWLRSRHDDEVGTRERYSAAVLKSWKRARFIGALLVGLYALLYVLLNLEAWSLLIGSVLLFVVLAGVMYATRGVDWSSVGRTERVS